ncbi:hypothetical protein ACFXJ8_33375 [Nonomuraea sp. NPDC059194]|uniref:hypothetical protein n=1 Tax=Nonomuraea sp. NPDC059194 TaxID=3346764 RepID=UPI003682A362
MERLGVRSQSFDGSLFIAAFSPEAVQITELFLSPAWRLAAEKIISSGDEFTPEVEPVAKQLNQLLGRTGMGIWDSYVLERWLAGVVGSEQVEPGTTFPHTRGRTVDGTPTGRLSFHELERRRKARQEFRKHHHVPHWLLPDNARAVQNAESAPASEQGAHRKCKIIPNSPGNRRSN